MVRALASHRCGPGSIPEPGVTCGLSLLLVLAMHCSDGFFPGSPVFLPLQKPTFLNSNSIRNSRATGLSVEYLDCCVSPSLNKVDYRYTCTSFYMLNTGIKLLYTLLSLYLLIISILFCKIITCACTT